MSINAVMSKGAGKIQSLKVNSRWRKSLNEILAKSECRINPLSTEQIKEIKDYYARFGFKSIKTDWHQYIYSVSGEYSPQIVPEDFFHSVLERIYNNSKFYLAYEDKAFMPFLLDTVRFPETIFTNVNGYFYDKNGNMISAETAKKMAADCGEAFAKPTLRSGGGKEAMLVSPNNYKDIFNKLKNNYIVQKRIIQSPETASYNPSSVNTEKVVSFLYKGEVYILSSIMRVGAENAITDAAAGGKGYFFGINEDGKTGEFGINVFGKRREHDYTGHPIKGRTISHHKEIISIFKKAHKRFPYFGFMSWDFCVNDKDEVVLIEYNTGYPVAMVYQMVTGPFLGDLTSDVLKDASTKLDRLTYKLF